jgi:hypothetical protein
MSKCACLAVLVYGAAYHTNGRSLRWPRPARLMRFLLDKSVVMRWLPGDRDIETLHWQIAF